MAGINAVAREVNTNAVFVDIHGLVDATVSFAQGDLLIFNSGSGLVALPAAESEGASFLGVAPVTVVAGKLPAAYLSDVTPGTPAIPGPQFGDDYKVILKAGDTMAVGALVYLDPINGTRHVQASGTKAVGVYVGTKSVTGATGGSEIVCKLGTRFPSDALKW